MITKHLAPTIVDDGWSGTVTYFWEQMSGFPAVIVSPTAAATDVQLPDVQGFYIFRITVANDAFSSTAIMRVFANLGLGTTGPTYKRFQVLLDGVEISILDGSLNINENRPGEANTATFRMQTPVSPALPPRIGQLVEINRIDTVEPGETGSVHEVTDHFSGNGVTTTFPLTFQLVLAGGVLGRGYVTYNNGGGPVNETLSYVGGGGTWEYDPSVDTIHRATGAPVIGVNNIEIIYSTMSYPGAHDETQLVFAGIISSDVHTYFEKRIHGLDEVNCIDWTWYLIRRRVSATYHNTSVAVIAADLIARVSVYGITLSTEGGLPMVPDISFSDATVADAFRQLCDQVPGLNMTTDYLKVVHVYIIDPVGADPGPINDVEDQAFNIVVKRDLTQAVNRVKATGTGSQARLDVLAASSDLFVTEIEIPLPDFAPGVPQPPRAIFGSAGSVLINGTQETTYGFVETDWLYYAENVTLLGLITFAWQNIGDVVPALIENGYYDNLNSTWTGPTFKGDGKLIPMEPISYAFTYSTALGETQAIITTGYLEMSGTAHGILVPPVNVNTGSGASSVLAGPLITQINVYRSHSALVGGYGLLGSVPPGGGLFVNSMSTIDFGAKITAGEIQGLPTTFGLANEVSHRLGISGIPVPIKEGDSVTVLAVVDDTAAQAALAALLGGSDDGVIEGVIQDGSLVADELVAFAEKYLAENSTLTTGLTYDTRDKNAHPSRTQSVDLGQQDPIVGDFTVQTVGISDFYQGVPPVYHVDASPKRKTLEDFLLGSRS